jgi:Fic family protein
MAMTEVELLKEISRKLSQLLVLTKLSNSKVIAETKEEIKRDPVAKAILALADGLLTSLQLKEKVVEQTKVSERTVQRRILDLVEKGAITPVRKGAEVYYEDSGLYD